MSLGKNLRQLRQDKGWSQTNLSERTGIKIGHISKLEQGEGDPKLSTLRKLWQALGSTPDALLLDEQELSTDGAMRQAFGRALGLPDEEKQCLTNIARKFCIAHGVAQALAPLDPENTAGWKPLDEDQ